MNALACVPMKLTAIALEVGTFPVFVMVKSWVVVAHAVMVVSHAAGVSESTAPVPRPEVGP